MNNNLKSPKKVIALTFIDNIAGNVTRHVFNREQKANLASFRLQLHPALISCKNLGYEIEVWSLHNTHPEHIKEIKNFDLCIVGKMSSNDEELANQFTMINLAILARINRINIPIIIIYSDNHWPRDDSIGYFYRDIMRFANSIVCPTKKLAKMLSQHTLSTTSFFEIVDPWHFDEMNDLDWNPNSNYLNLIWFGSASNVQYLINIFPELIQSVNTSRNIKLTILSSKVAHTQFKKNISYKNQSKKKWEITFKVWDPNLQPIQLRNELHNAQLTLLPSNPNDLYKCGVSHNRFVDSIRGGTIPIASPMESYVELSELGLIGNDFPKMINFAEKNITSIWKHIKSIRHEKIARFSPHQNKKNWEKIILSVNKVLF